MSVGIPVRNGGDAFSLALATILDQTYTKLEIIISDNASSDRTGEVGQAAAAADPRVRYVRQEHPLSAPGNLRYVFEQATGEFFMWAAHDDLRSLNYIEVLLGALLASPDAGLAFGDLWLIHDYTDLAHAEPITRLRGTDGGTLRQRVMFPWRSCLPIYGLFRTAALAGYRSWDRTLFGDDVPILASVAAAHEVLRVEGASFYYWGGEHEAVQADRQRRDKRAVPRWRFLRLHWVVADEVRRATGRRRLGLFAYVQAKYWWWHLRGRVAALLPDSVLDDWRRQTDIRQELRAQRG